MDKNAKAEIELEDAVRMESVEAFVLEVLHDEEYQHPTFHPKRWKLSYKTFLYQMNDLQCYELKFEWKHFLSKFSLPNRKMISETGLIRSWFRGVDKREVYVRAKLKEDNLIFDLDFIPHASHIGKLHYDLSLPKALHIIERYTTI